MNVVWQFSTVWVDARKDREPVITSLPVGWEPFQAVGVAGAGWVVYLRRIEQ